MEEKHDVTILELRDHDETFFVRALVDQQVISHSFPYDEEYISNDGDLEPGFVRKLCEKKEKLDVCKDKSVEEACGVFEGDSLEVEPGKNDEKNNLSAMDRGTDDMDFSNETEAKY